MTSYVSAEPRLAVAHAADAPAPTIVADGLKLDAAMTRDEVLRWFRPYRLRAMCFDTRLGAKSGVLLTAGGALRFEFLQGLPDGSVDDSVLVCVNSAAAAVTAAVHAWNVTLGTSFVDLRMGDQALGLKALA